METKNAVFNAVSFSRFAGTEELNLCKEHFSDPKEKERKRQEKLARLKAARAKAKKAKQAKKGKKKE